MSETSQTNERHCVKCGKSMMWDANVCPYCGHDYRQQSMAPPQMAPPAYMGPPPKPKSAVPIVAGVFNLLTAIMGIVSALLLIVYSDYLSGLFSVITDLIGLNVGTLIALLGVVGILMSVLVLLSAVFAINRTHFGFAVVGALLGMILVGPFTFYFSGCLLSLIALIMLAVSSKEFS